MNGWGPVANCWLFGVTHAAHSWTVEGGADIYCPGGRFTTYSPFLNRPAHYFLAEDVLTAIESQDGVYRDDLDAHISVRRVSDHTVDITLDHEGLKEMFRVDVSRL